MDVSDTLTHSGAYAMRFVVFVIVIEVVWQTNDNIFPDGFVPPNLTPIMFIEVDPTQQGISCSTSRLL